jgi:transposase-like protein
VTTGAKTIAAVTEEFDLTETALRAWVKRAEADEGKGTRETLTTAERSELIDLRKRLKRAEMERDILKNYLGASSHLLDQKLGKRYSGPGPGGAAGCFLETATIP